jgi:drug/metabolite transporter (DMT)-like permease
MAVMRVIQTTCNKKVSNLLRSDKTNLHFLAYQNLVSAVAAIVLVLIGGFYGFDMPTFIIGFFMGLSITAAVITSFESLKSSSILLVYMISNASIILPTVLGIFLFGEQVSLFQWLGVVMFLISSVFIVKSSQQATSSLTVKSILFLLAVFISNGIIMILQKYFAIEYPKGNIALFNFAAYFTNAVLFYIIVGFLALKKKQMPQRLGKPLLINGALLSLAIFIIGQLVTLCARTISSAVLFTVSGGISLIVAALVSSLVFKEKFNINSLLGLITSLAAIVILSVF